MTIAPDVFPLDFRAPEVLSLQAAGLILGAASFAASGRERARRGAIFGLTVGAVGWCASRWPQLSRALDLSGAVFAGPLLRSLVAPAFGLSAVGAAALLLKGPAPLAPALVAAVALWAAPTLATEAALARWWGLGPRSLAEAAAIPTDADARLLTVVRLSSSRGSRTSRETILTAASLRDFRPREPASTGVDLSAESLAKLEGFLRRSGYRGVFVGEALAHLRRGRLMWWDAERALDAMMLASPGRVSPDYRGALDLIKVGPMTAERFAKLERLDAAATADPRSGFEQVTESQYIFEGFAAAYARFGEEAKARRWLAHIDNLLLVTEKKVEVAPLEDFRAGRIAGSVTLGGRPARGVKVGLFEIWRTTPTSSGLRLLSGSTFPDARGRFSFANLGPGQYELGLLGRASDLRGRVHGSPGRFAIGYSRPSALLAPIKIDRGAAPATRIAPPLAEEKAPERPLPPLLWRKR